MKLRKLTKKRSRQLLPSPGDLFAQPPAAFYRNLNCAAAAC